MAWARVTGPGDADAVCEAVAAAITAEYLRRDANALLDIHVSGGFGALFIAGTVSSTADFDVSSIVRAELGAIDPALQLEPFITIEPMTEPRAFGGAEAWTATAYATKANDESTHDPLAFALRCARLLEQKRQQDPDWYWLTSDYHVAVSDDAQKRHVQLSVWHSDGVTPDEVRQKIAAALTALVSTKSLSIDVICQQGAHSLLRRIGSSRQPRLTSFARAPLTLHGAGYELQHPTNLGQWYARAIAKELVRSQGSEAVALELDWFALESKPRAVRAVDSQGRDCSGLIDLDRCDLAKPPTGWNEPSFLSDQWRWQYDASIHLPWEG